MIFPHPLMSNKEGFLCYGGDLDPKRLICAYHFGIFPWYNENPILWWSTHPRTVLFPEEFRLSKSMKKFIRDHNYRVSVNEDFLSVITSCMHMKRKDQEGSWLNMDMIDSYEQMNRMGYAHSVEVWNKNELLAGLYGVVAGRIFFGESMFTNVPNGSKLALYYLVELLKKQNCKLIDCQQDTAHMKSLGACSIGKDQFWNIIKLNLLEDAMSIK